MGGVVWGYTLIVTEVVIIESNHVVLVDHIS
jgi:hypothetical protein